MLKRLTTFLPNPNFDEEMAQDDDFRAEIERQIEVAKGYAEAFSPVFTGAYQDAFVIVEDGDAWLFGNTDFKAHWIEWGTAITPPHAVLRRGVMAAGFHFVPTSK